MTGKGNLLVVASEARIWAALELAGIVPDYAVRSVGVALREYREPVRTAKLVLIDRSAATVAVASDSSWGHDRVALVVDGQATADDERLARLAGAERVVSLPQGGPWLRGKLGR